MPNDTPETSTPESNESFKDLLSQYERSHARKGEDGQRQLEGTVITVSAEAVYLDIGYKSEGILPFAEFQRTGETPKPGDKFLVTVKGRDPEGYYELSRFKVARPTDWSSLEQAFANKSTIVGTVTAAIKGGVSVDVGVRAFMPASRSGTHDAAELEKLVGQEIRCRIIKLDVADEDVVVDRRAVLEDEVRSAREHRYSELAEGDVVTGTVRSLTDYGAFVDIGSVDALLHVSDISLVRVTKPSDVLSVGQQVEVKVLKIASEGEKRRISVGMKQLQADPWTSAESKYRIGERVRGTVSRVLDFGAFVEIEPGLEGLIHVSEMSWAKKVRKASDMLKPGESVEAVILSVNVAEHRISLGLKQALGDPWKDASQKFPAGSVVSGPITSLTKFGAFVQIAEGVEGMIHVSEITGERRINHPQEVLKAGQIVQAQVLSIDTERRLIRLSMKQLTPTDLDEYLAEHKPGDVVTGRVVDVSGNEARVELGEGVFASCRIAAGSQARQESGASAKADLSSLSSLLEAKWKGTGGSSAPQPESIAAGQVRSFRIQHLDVSAKKIELALAQ